tara:strand:- start:6908 stop:7162 length:255 start_codon:yes stop_codon:yes gene_type:complete
MKKVLCGLVIALMMTGSGYAKKFSDGTGNIILLELRVEKDTDYMKVRTYCIHGNMFVSFLSGNDGFSSNQVFTNQDGKSLPKEC